MALRKNTNAATTNAPAFEDDTNVIENAAVQTEVATPEVKVAATTVVAKAAASAAVASAAAKKFSAAFQDYENIIELDTVEGMSGSFPKVTADLGGLDFGDKKVCQEIKVELISYNRRYLASTGTQGEDAKKFLRTSYDGVTIPGHTETLQEYVQYLKDVEGYTKAGIRDYMDLWVMVVEEDGQVVPDEERQMVQLQLSPQSVKAFKAFQVKQGFMIGRGIAKDTNQFRVAYERKDSNGNKYANLTFRA